MRLLVALMVISCGLFATTAAAQQWTRFRGPNGTGVSDCRTIPVKWTEDDYRWRSDLPGSGSSSPVVWGDRIFILSADPETATRYVLCYSATDGRQLWVREFPSTPHHMHVQNSYASSTPAVDDQHVYVSWATFEKTTLKALDHQGNDAWDRDLGTWLGQHGYGTSPMVHGDLVVLHHSQQAIQLEPGQQPGESAIVAVDRHTGRDVWRTPLKTVRVCYAVPFVHQSADDREELVCASTGQGIFGLDPSSGRQNWSIDVFDQRVVSSPIFAGGLVWSSNGSGGMSGNYIVGVKPGPNPNLTHKFGNGRNFKAPYVVSAVADRDNLFLVYDRGFITCIDAPSGEVHWCERTGGSFSGSPVLVGNRIYVIEDGGDVWVIAADPDEYRLLAKNPLGENSRATPAVADGRMYLRTESQMFCVDGSEPSGAEADAGG